MNGIVLLRFVIVGLGLVLGIALIARGNVVIGGLIVALSIARIAMFLSMRKRRREFRQQFPGRFNQRQAGNDRWT